MKKARLTPHWIPTLVTEISTLTTRGKALRAETSGYTALYIAKTAARPFHTQWLGLYKVERKPDLEIAFRHKIVIIPWASSLL